jgi:polysaccharide deacetylase family protein (PEP-CTERM system associated)
LETTIAPHLRLDPAIDGREKAAENTSLPLVIGFDAETPTSPILRLDPAHGDAEKAEENSSSQKLNRFEAATNANPILRSDPAHGGQEQAEENLLPQIVISFDVEEHFRIEAAAGLKLNPGLKAHYCERLEPSTRWLLDELEKTNVKATFFIVGQIGRHHPALIRAIHGAGHEVASHGWDHQRVVNFTPATFREDVRQSKDALEQVTGQAVVGYRAPTFSIMRQTAWALDVLGELDMVYDSSIYPVRHDRYGIPSAPRAPFTAVGETRDILEIPPATLRLLKFNFPMGGGGYFRLFPLFFLEWAIRQAERGCVPPVAMLYFHPWEFDSEQERLPLRWLSRLRTYVGIRRSRGRFTALLSRHRFVRAIDAARRLSQRQDLLPRFAVGMDSLNRQVLTKVDTL